jgi:hypothetical protein
MKRVLLATLLLTALSAHATDRNPLQPSSNAAIGVGIGTGGDATSSATGGAGGYVYTDNDYGDLKIPPLAIAPNINTNIICPMVMQGSKAGSIWPFSLSGTHEPDLVPICVAWHLGQTSVVEKMTCNASKEYREANPKCPKK